MCWWCFARGVHLLWSYCGDWRFCLVCDRLGFFPMIVWMIDISFTLIYHLSSFHILVALLSNSLQILQFQTLSLLSPLSGAGILLLFNGGFALLPGDSNTLHVPPACSDRLWGWTLCSIDVTGKFSYVIGDYGTLTVECVGTYLASLITLVEFD